MNKIVILKTFDKKTIWIIFMLERFYFHAVFISIQISLSVWRWNKQTNKQNYVQFDFSWLGS